MTATPPEVREETIQAGPAPGKGDIETFITVYRVRLNAAFGLRWKRAPAYTAIRYILQGLDPQAVEQVFRLHAATLAGKTADPACRSIALDGKTLRRSFDNFRDRKAAQLLHAFDTEAGLVLAHIDIEEKSNEIPAAQRLLLDLRRRPRAPATTGSSVTPSRRV
jgi:hypothetical protein